MAELLEILKIFSFKICAICKSVTKKIVQTAHIILWF